MTDTDSGQWAVSSWQLLPQCGGFPFAPWRAFAPLREIQDAQKLLPAKGQSLPSAGRKDAKRGLLNPGGNCKLIFQLLLVSILLNTILGCASADTPLFKKLSPSATGIAFENQLQYADSLSVLEFEYMFNGSGVALLDVNNDGLQDIFFGGNMVSCKLYLNKGGLHFEDITERAGVKTTGWVYGISIVDINQDGFADIYLCKAGSRKTPPASMRNMFFINNGDNTFTDKAAQLGLDDDGYDIHAAFLDYDKDGDLDMYLLRNGFVNYNRNTARQKIADGGAPSNDKLFRNNGDQSFTDVSREAGIIIEGFGLGVSVCDLNNDDWPDLYVSNDFLTNDLTWINNRNGTFTNQTAACMGHQTYNAMGNDVADYNNDGLEDIMVVDMLPPDNRRQKLTMRGNTFEEFQNALSFGYEPQYVRNTLQLNNGDGTFSEIGQLAGVQATEWSWAPLFADFDNDGYKDLFISNGYRQDITNLDFIKYGKRAMFVGTPEANRRERLDQLKKFPGIQVHDYLFSNRRDLRFQDVSVQWGMDDPGYSNGAAYGDLDNDGDLDLVINRLDQVSPVYENRSAALYPDKGWLRIGFKGKSPNRTGLGAKVSLWQHGNLQVNYFSPYRGYLSTVEGFLHFGIRRARVDSLKVSWPDGNIQVIKNIEPNQLLWLDQAAASDSTKNIAVPVSSIRMLHPCPNNCGIRYQHHEDDFVDFKVQPLLPHLLSHEGPGLAAADVNGDGLDDFFAGAARGSSPGIFIQQRTGGFLKKECKEVNVADDMGALFFDADTDGDADLYVASGGSATKMANDSSFRHHLYLNDGYGNFTDDRHALPPILVSAASVAGADYDHDGDIDLFVCGRLAPGSYPDAPPSFLLKNNSTKGTCRFDSDSTNGINLSAMGMVTSALWTDFNNDSWPDLIVAGEFMPIRFFKNSQGRFRETTNETGLQHTSGWWNSIAGGDFDKDGDIDYVLGNLGLNSTYKASAAEPFCVYASDFDKDGRPDPVLTHFLDGEEYIMHARDDINRQINAMRGRFRTYEAYADVNFRNAFREDEIDNARLLKAERFESSYLENQGNGKFMLRSLPLHAQFAPIYGMVCSDFTGDGNMDVLCVGNSFATEVQTGRYDAQGSLLLRGDGKGHFASDPSGAGLSGDNKSVIQLGTADSGSLVLIGCNSDSLRAFRPSVKQRQLSFNPGEMYAIVTGADGKTYRQELYYGHTYLSQSSRRIWLSHDARTVEIFSINGSKRKIEF